MSSPGPSSTRLLLAYVGCVVLWGSTWAVVKVGLEDLPPLHFAGVRMLLAGLALLPFAGLRQAAGLGPRVLGQVVGVGVLQLAVSYGLMFVAQQWIASSWCALLFCTFPVWLLLVGRVLLPDQPLTLLKLLSAALGLGGVLVLQGEQLGGLGLSGLAVAGCVLMVLAAFCVALSNVLVRRQLGHVPPRLMVCVQTLVSGVLLLGVSALAEADRAAHWTPHALGALVYLSLFGTVLTYQLFYWLIPRLSLSAIGVVPLLDTLVAVLLGVVLLGEPVTLWLVAGGALILGGAALANLLPAAPAAPESAETPARTALG